MSLSSMGTAEASRMLNDSKDNAMLAGPSGVAGQYNAMTNV